MTDRESQSEQEKLISDSIRSWRLTDLAGFAVDRHGYGNTDGGFGVTYPGDLDEDDREVEGCFIPEGSVEIYGFWGADAGGYEFQVPETTYLTVLSKVLRAKGLESDAATVEALKMRLHGS